MALLQNERRATQATITTNLESAVHKHQRSNSLVEVVTGFWTTQELLQDV